MHIRKTVAGLGLAVLAAVLPSAKLTAAPTLTSPGDYATVKVQTSEMESFLATPAARTMSTYGTSTKSSATRLTYQGYYAANNTAVTLKWSGTSGSSTVKVYRSSNLNTAVFSQTTSGTSVEFWDAEIGRNYTWTVENGGQKTRGHFFVARTAPRIINGPHAADPSGDQVGNARDLGGWLTTDGKVVRQGKLFRSRQFDWCWPIKAEKGKNYNGNKYWSQTIGIKFDLDLREIAGDSGIQACLDNPSNYPLGDGEVNKSPIGPNIPRYCSEMDGVLNFHDGKASVTDKDCRIAFAHVFSKLIDSSNWPLVFHCAHGKDRTGQLAMITLGLLGVDYNSIALDYSCAWIYKAEWTMGSFEPDDLQDALNTRYGSGLTLKAKCEKYVKECAKDAGLTLTDTQLANFRNAMLEMPETAAVNPVGPTPTGTAVVPPTLKTARVKFDYSAHPPTVVDSADKAYYTVTIPSGDYIEPGVFPITVSLKNPSTSCWSDTKTSADRTLEYVIYADTTWNNEPCVPSFQQGNAGAAIAFPGYSKRGGGYGAVCNLTPAQLRSLGPGTHEATFTMAESQTWTGTTITKSFRVLAADEQPQYLYDYLEMSGDSGVSFLTGLTPDCTKERMEISWAFTKAQVLTTEYSLFQSAAKFIVHVGDGDNNDQIDYRNGYNITLKGPYSNTASANLGTGLHTVSVCGKTLTFDGVTQSASGAPAENKDAAYPLIICAGYLGGPNYCPTGFRLYGFKVYASASATTPTHDYTPAKLADGTPVLYDLVTKTILPPTYTKASAAVTAGGTARDVPGAGCVHAWSAWSADTATKSAGGSITRTCSKCNESQTRTTPQLWDWLKTDGKGYFNTNWRPDLSTYLINLRIRFGTDVLDAAAVQGLLVGNGHVEKQGAYLNALNLNFEKTGSTRGTGTTWDYDYYSAVSSSGSNAYVGLDGDETRIQEITLSGKTVTLDGKTAGSGSLASGVLSSDLYLMTSYSKSNARFQSMTKGYLYGVTLGSKNGTGTTVAHKYRPALNGTVATLWDEVEGEYLEVLNGGVFSVGNDEATHVHAWSAWSADTATKSAGGSITRTCSKCNEAQTRATPQLWDWLKTDGKGYVCASGFRPNLKNGLVSLRVRFDQSQYDQISGYYGLFVANAYWAGGTGYGNAINLNFHNPAQSGHDELAGSVMSVDYYNSAMGDAKNLYLGFDGDTTSVHTLEARGASFAIDGVVKTGAGANDVETDSPLYLFVTGKGVAGQQCRCHVYGVTLGTGTTVAHKYRPALNGTVATLWDEVEGEYLEVLNGGVFSVGNDGAPGPDPSYVYGSPDTANLTYTWRTGNGVWANPAAWTASRTPCYGIPSNTTYATAAFPASLTGTPVVTVAGRYPVKAFSFANTVPLTFAFEGENTGFDLAQGPSGYQLFGTGKDETPATTFRFVIPAGGYAAAPIRTLVDDAPVFIGLSTKFVVDASAMAVPSLNTAVTNVLIQATDGVRFFEKKSEPLASTVYGDRVLAAAEITVPAGAKGVLLVDGKKVVFVLRNANWQPEVVPQPESPDIYLLLGQSNMAGYGTLGEVADVDTSRISKWDFENDRWIPATDPLVPGCGVGLGTSFARAMADADSAKEIAVINAAKGATYLAQWQKGTALYDRALEILRLALAKGGTLKGILWHQGCYDAIAETDANTYAERFQELVADLRADLGDATLPIVMGELPRTLDESKLGSRAYWRTVNAQLATAVEALDQAALVSSEGLDTLAVDRTHFTASSQRTFGVRYATAMQTLQGNVPHEHAWSDWSEDTATKAAGGEQTRHCTCEGCDATETRATPQRWDWLMTDDRGYYITDYVPNLAKTRIEMKVGFLSDDYSGMFTASPMVVGGAKDWTDVMSLQLDQNVDYYNNSLGTQIRPSVGFAREGETHTYDITGNSFSVDGGEPYSLEGKTAADKPASGPLAFLVTHFGNSLGFLYHPSRKVYYIRVTTDGTSAMRLRPAKDGNGVATLWDEVTGEYLPIANGGVFSVGNDSDETQESIDNGRSGDRIVIPSGKTATLLEDGQLKVGDKTYAPKEHYVFKAVDGGFALEIAQEEAVVADISIAADGTVTVTTGRTYDGFWYALEESSALPFEPVGEPEWQKLDETGKLSVEGDGQGGFYRLKVTDRDKQ